VETALHGGDAEEMWPLVVTDVSSGGLGVLLARRFEPGTELSIELGAGPHAAPRRLSAWVVRVQPESAGHWIHGCVFANSLPDDEVAALLKYT
jgi:hypothetical protein